MAILWERAGGVKRPIPTTNRHGFNGTRASSPRSFPLCSHTPCTTQASGIGANSSFGEATGCVPANVRFQPQRRYDGVFGCKSLHRLPGDVRGEGDRVGAVAYVVGSEEALRGCSRSCRRGPHRRCRRWYVSACAAGAKTTVAPSAVAAPAVTFRPSRRSRFPSSSSESSRPSDLTLGRGYIPPVGWPADPILAEPESSRLRGQLLLELEHGGE
jgi:hypothetical protein